MFSFWQGCLADRIAAPVMLEAGSAAPCGVDLEDSCNGCFGNTEPDGVMPGHPMRTPSSRRAAGS